jgi:hypothetical protein
MHETERKLGAESPVLAKIHRFKQSHATLRFLQRIQGQGWSVLRCPFLVVIPLSRAVEN